MDELEDSNERPGTRLFEQLMRFLPPGMTPNAWAVKAGVGRTIWADLKRHGNPSRRTLERLLGAAGSSLAEFEALRVGAAREALSTTAGLAEPARPWRSAPSSVPLLACSPAGEMRSAGKRIELYAIDRSTVVERLDRPAALASDANAYAVRVEGKSMWPRFRPGRRLLVSPAARVAVGDDVLVELHDGRTLLKELVRRTAGIIELRQFNPNLMFQLDAADVAAVHKVMGEAI